MDELTDLRVIEAAGTPRELGRAHGEQARDLIEKGLDQWRADCDARDIDADALMRSLARDTGFRAAAARWTPDLLDEVEGIAEGARVDRDLVFATNCLDEAWWWEAPASGCSVVAVTDRGTPVIGQNMDLDTWMDGTQVALRLRHSDGLEQVLLSRAGVVGLCGASSAGLGVMVNALDQLGTDPHGVPVAFVNRTVLAQRSLEDVWAVLHRVPHASGQAYTVATRAGVLGYECGATAVAEYVNDPERPGARWHTNHPLAPAATEAVALHPDGEEWDWATGSSLPRLAVLDEAVGRVVDGRSLETLLGDGEGGICMFPGRWREDGFTFGSVVVELGEPPVVRIAPGPPDRTPYVSVPFR